MCVVLSEVVVDAVRVDVSSPRVGVLEEETVSDTVTMVVFEIVADDDDDSSAEDETVADRIGREEESLRDVDAVGSRELLEVDESSDERDSLTEAVVERDFESISDSDGVDV